MKKILLMLVCMTDPSWAMRCNSYYRSDVPFTSEQTCPIGYSYAKMFLDNCPSNESDYRQVDFFVDGQNVYFCGNDFADYEYGHGKDCPNLSASNLPPTERKDISACNVCTKDAVGTPPNDCRCKAGYYNGGSHYCSSCPEGTTSPEGSIGASACKAALPVNAFFVHRKILVQRIPSA